MTNFDKIELGLSEVIPDELKQFWKVRTVMYNGELSSTFTRLGELERYGYKNVRETEEDIYLLGENDAIPTGYALDKTYDEEIDNIEYNDLAEEYFIKDE